MNLGVMGGTFDPVHNGHLVVAEEVRDRLNLAEVLFVPAGQPYLKTNSPVAVAEHRLQMVRLAIYGRAYFKLSTMEVERAGPSYTIDTVAELRRQFGAGGELFFILGWDNLTELPRWKEPSRLIEMCRLVAVRRPGYSLPDIGVLEAEILGLSKRVIVLNRPEVDISASDIRRRLAQGLSIRGLVPRPVEEYIGQHGLYTARE